MSSSCSLTAKANIRVRARLGDGSVSDWNLFGLYAPDPKPDEIYRYDFRAYGHLLPDPHRLLLPPRCE